MKLIGIGGLPRSGKDTLAEWLIEKGYFGFSFGDYTRAQARQRHADKPDPISVANMTETSNWLREAHGPDVILKAALKEFNQKQAAGADYKGLVLFSVRAPVEVDWILEHGGQLIWIETRDKLRYERFKSAQRQGEADISLQEFKRQENLQWQPQPNLPAGAQMNISYVKAKATIFITNDSNDLADFKKAAQKRLGELL